MTRGELIQLLHAGDPEQEVELVTFSSLGVRPELALLAIGRVWQAIPSIPGAATMRDCDRIIWMPEGQ